jgi:hypothetical protein
VAEVASYGWHFIHHLPSSPFGHDYRSCITLNIHPESQWIDSREPSFPLDIDLDITIVIGWHEAHHTEPLFSKERCAQAACGVLRQLDDFGVLNNDIQFSPYLENGGHRFCFPTQKPQDIIEADYPHSPIEFQSPCNCGMGDLTGSRFDCTRYCTARSTLTRALFGHYGRQSKLVSELGCKTVSKPTYETPRVDLILIITSYLHCTCSDLLESARTLSESEIIYVHTIRLSDESIFSFISDVPH